MHVPEQQEMVDEQAAPVMAHAAGAAPQTGGLPMQAPLVHSNPA
jgi:hypothetical protein